MLTLSKAQAATQAAQLALVRPELAAAYTVALERWMGDRKLLLLGLPIITEGHRSNATQAAYYAQGRPLLYPLAELNRLRKVAGLGPFSAKSTEARRIITYQQAGASNHNHMPSWALDVALLQADGSLTWDAGALLLFARLVRAADARVVHGADWDHDGRTDDQAFHDWPHFELTA
ncbi:M15 family metallopeptidase domain-containing protein [Hymenobacter terricola]|uniref:M15 family peptidase n=1 Tax=Hymenobacter terricola TaxID=2819236 RepID=UPI001B3183E8|nr:M15 family peptidase [Hymenobacter terricola]